MGGYQPITTRGAYNRREHMRRRLKYLACLCFLLLAWATFAWCTLLEYRSPQQLGAQSELVVRGRVESSRSYWNEKHTKIFTRTRIAVDEAYKGSAPATVDVIQLGGTVGNVRVTVHGALHWRVGEEVLLFAEPYDGGSFRVSGFSQGRFKIERDPETGAPFVRAPRPEGVQILGAPPGGQARASVRGVPLAEFVSYALGRPSIRGVTE
jgi:hypothetical protein